MNVRLARIAVNTTVITLRDLIHAAVIMGIFSIKMDYTAAVRMINI